MSQQNLQQDTGLRIANLNGLKQSFATENLAHNLKAKKQNWKCKIVFSIAYVPAWGNVV
jgi:hypothetical protein